MRNIDYTKDRTYKSWESMKSRCQNIMNPRYDSYGGQGITVCSEWQSFDKFKEDMGERPLGKTLGRIDNSKGYCKENCAWQTAEEQQRNTVRSKLDAAIVCDLKLKSLGWKGSQRALAREFADTNNLPFETVREVLKGRTWK